MTTPFRPASSLVALSVAATLCACNQSSSSTSAIDKPSSSPPAATSAAARAEPDPCTLLSAGEAQTYVGALVMPPFRGNDDGAPDAGGDACIYRGSQARQLDITPTYEGSATAGQAAEDIPNLLGGALDKAGAGNLGATAHRVMAQVPDGAWDKATWIPGGTLFVTKGGRGVNVDVGGASGKQEDAVAIARLIVPRFDHPLDYDGAKAVAALPAAKPHPTDPCQVAPRAAVEGAIGPLSHSPATTDQSTCAYQVASAEGARTYAIEYVWQGGSKNFNTLKNMNGTLGSAMGGAIPTTGMDSMKMDPNMSKMIGGLMNLAGGGSGGAPGAATQVGFKTDTNLQGPWDSAMLMHGTQLLAVKNDVMVSMDLRSADYEKAKALLAVLCSSL
jgi:hypothetical protein